MCIYIYIYVYIYIYIYTFITYILIRYTHSRPGPQQLQSFSRTGGKPNVTHGFIRNIP